MGKIDFKRDLKQLYQPSAQEAVQVSVPKMNFLMLDGEGDPNTSTWYQAGVEALFTLSYTIKFMVKKGARGIAYGVMPLEGLWWTDSMSEFSTDDKAKWKWTIMIMQPDIVTRAMVATAMEEVGRKKALAATGHVRFTAWEEGRCAQILHIGPFSAEGPTIQRLHQFIADCGCNRAGKHHEIYLSDIRKADPAKWKTIIRQGMQ